MRILDNLERKYARYIPYNITKILIAAQFLGFLLFYTNSQAIQYFFISGKLLLQGQVWRILTGLFMPVSDNILFFGLGVYFFYILGSALENQWGSFRYLAYILIGYFAMITGSLLAPDTVLSNIYIFSSLFLAFAHLFPRFQVLLFFVLPIEIRWLGYLAWLGIIVSFITGTLADKVLILFSLANFILFFSGDILSLVRRSGMGPREGGLKKQKPNHICAVCGDNEIDNPYMEIRYCGQCVPSTCYCGKHISDHQHKRVVN